MIPRIHLAYAFQILKGKNIAKFLLPILIQIITTTGILITVGI